MIRPQSAPGVRPPLRRLALALSAASFAFAAHATAQTTTVQLGETSLLDSPAYQSTVRDFADTGPAVLDVPAPTLPGAPTMGPSNQAGDIESAIANAIAGGSAQTGGPGAPVLELLRRSEDATGRTHVRLHQTVDGTRVWGTDIKGTVEGGRLVHTVARTVDPSATVMASLVPEERAIDAAVRQLHGASANAADFWHEAPRATRVLIPTGAGLEMGWEVVTWTEEENLLHHTLVDSRGQVVESQLRTSQDRYRVYPNSPTRGSQVVRSGPGTSGNAQSPAGWLSGNQYTRLIQGNNVAAYMDTDNNNSPDGGVVVPVTNGDFLAVHEPNSSPTTSANRDVAVQNLFWLNNIIHDYLYARGFTEGVGNFQNDNFGRGGAGNDSVYAEAQDGGGVNNANFATPGDGSHPRMQMYVWDRTNPNRDGDLDSDIVWHEYGHGLTWRMIGDMSGSVAGAIGEGMGDVLAILYNGDDAVGEYSLNNPAGIRSARYGNYNRTLGDFTGSSIHFDGEIYAAAMWRAGENYRSAGLSRTDLMDVAVSGMNYTPSRPDYIEMRDGLLRAAPSSEDCLIWDAFAEYGMGEGARFSISGGSVSITESTRVPSACGGAQPPTSTPTTVRALSPRSAWTGSTWRGQVVVTLDGTNKANQAVRGRWTNGLITNCTTNTNGQCVMTRTRINRRWSSVGFTVQTVAGQTAQGSPLTVRVYRP